MPDQLRMITSLDDLADKVIDVPVELPDGEKVIVPLKALSEGAVFARRQQIDWPSAPTTDFEKVGGKIVPARNFQDPDYLKAVRNANRRLAFLLLLDSVTFDVPGANDDEKVQALQVKLGQYIFSQLISASDKLNMVDQEVIANAARSFRAKRIESTSSDGAPQPDAERVAGSTAV